MAAGRSTAGGILVEFALLVVLWFGVAVLSGADAQSDSCVEDLSIFLPAPFNGTDLQCRTVWNNFVLRYSQSQDNVLSIVLSTVYTSGWVGIGFSKDGMMIGSSAMVGWVGRDRKVHIRQYFLGGQTSSKVVVNQGDLQKSDVEPRVVLYGSNIYLAFQVKFPSPVTQQSILLAFAAAAPINAVLGEHDDKISINFDFSSGTTAPSSYPYFLKRNHGALAIVGWGVLLPIGALVARHCKQWDPLWYYLHVGIQFLGFMIGLAAVVAGVSLYARLHADLPVHRGIGIFVLILGILQVLAFFLRPHKESKYRRYWNWYHQWFGRLALFFAAVNIVLGIQAGSAGQAWKVGYGVNLAIILISSITLEIMLCLRSSKKPVPSPVF